MKSILTAVFLFLALSVANAKPLRILTYEEVKGLGKTSRQDYVHSIAKVLTALSEQKPKRFSFFEELLSFGSIAYAAPTYQCIGGGVPVDTKAKSCGVQSYAGFTCASGKNICNPLIFGVNKSGEPVCHERATTKWCFDNTVVGRDQTLEPVFNRKDLDESKRLEEWNKLREALEQACNNPSMVQENAADVAEACNYVRQQMRVNEDIRKLMAKGFTYRSEGGLLSSCKTCQASQARSNIQTLQATRAAYTPAIASVPAGGGAFSSAEAFYASYKGGINTNGKVAAIPGVKGQLISPMPGCSYSRDHYHYRSSGHFHPAQDLISPYGAPVQSVAPGIVVTAFNGCRARMGCPNGYGNSVMIMHKTADGEVFYTGYNHLASVNLRPGDRVAAGSQLGTMGNTGYSTGPHLHFEIMDKNKVRTNPMAYYPQGICSPNSTPGVNMAAL